MFKDAFKKIIPAVMAVFLIIVSIDFTSTNVQAAELDINRPSTDGALKVVGSKLCNQNGNEVLLRGVSEHGITYFKKYVDETFFSNVSNALNANVIRLPLYTSQFENSIYCDDPLALMKQGIEYAIANDMYVIVDWHSLENPDPNMDIYNASRFFKDISEQYGDCPNIIYEICNEPNGGTTWNQICMYANVIIPLIRQNSPNSVILVGTPNLDFDITAPADGALNKYSNLMYTFHFYASSHIFSNCDLDKAVNMGLPVFISECGFSEASGDGFINMDSSREWLSYLKEKNLSHVIWNLSDKNETSSFLRSGVRPDTLFDDNSLTVSGKMTKTWLVYNDPSIVGSDLNLWDKFRVYTGFEIISVWLFFAVCSIIFVGIVGLLLLLLKNKGKKYKSYYRLLKESNYYENPNKGDKFYLVSTIILIIGILVSIIYLLWRFQMSLPVYYGVIPLICSIILLIVEVLGFFESSVHYCGLLSIKKCKLPKIKNSDFPDVDIFISTYNEPVELLRKTLFGCKKMDYPDLSKVHIYLCDDNKRDTMKKLAKDLGVNYLDRDTHEHAKAGNLNHALSVTSSPYIVTFDADMIPRKEFLMKTIPYFVDAEKRNEKLPKDRKMPLGFIQTPQCFYNPDVFQHNFKAEQKIPNEQDYFYRTIEVAKINSNSVIYGGSNTIISRAALEAIGGFYTDSITEDFATGALIEAAGFISLGLPEPLASGLSTYSFADHIKQRTRWARGVINTAKKIKFIRNNNLTFSQKAQYLTSVLYWYSPIKNYVYILAPLAFAVFDINVVACDFLDLLVFWLPLFIMQSVNMKVSSRGTALYRYCVIQQMVLMPFLFFDVIKETFGFSLSQFLVTDKSKGAVNSNNTRYIAPFAILIGLSIIAVVRIVFIFAINMTVFVSSMVQSEGLTLASINNMPLGLLIPLFWIVRNLVFLIACVRVVRGREDYEENVKVKAAYLTSIKSTKGAQGNDTDNDIEYDGIITGFTEHSLTVFLENAEKLRLGQSVVANISFDDVCLDFNCVVIHSRRNRNRSVAPFYTLEILDFKGNRDEYLYELYNRIPSLAQKF